MKTRRPQRLHRAAEILDAGERAFAIVFQLELDAKTQKAFGVNIACLCTALSPQVKVSREVEIPSRCCCCC